MPPRGESPGLRALPQVAAPVEGGPLRPAPSMLRRSEGLLRSASRLLRLQLEIVGAGGLSLGSTAAGAGCLRCAREDSRRHAACGKLAQAHCREILRGGEAATWTCPQGTQIWTFPILSRNRTAAVLLARDGRARRAGAGALRRRRSFLKDLARLLSDQLFLYDEMNELNGELSTRNNELRMFYSVAGRLASQEDLRQCLRQMLEETRQAIDADAVLLALGDRRLTEVLLRDGAAADRNGNRRQWERIARFLRRQIERQGTGYYTGLPWDPEDPPAPDHPSAQVMAVSVQHKGRPAGVLGILHFEICGSFRSSDIKLLQSLSEQVALVVDNSELYEDLKEFLMATVKTLVGAIEAKDAYTSGHSERVNLVSMLLGRQMGLTPPEMETLRWASILHDVGKIGMPESILLKPGRLTSEEFEIIKQHPDRGYTLLSPIRQLSAAAECVRAHHEKVDGTGYPLGLQAKEIPVLSRIIAVADTYDALTSTRAYRSARSLDYAVAEIRRVRGTQLDCEVVDRLLSMESFLREHHVMIGAEEPIQAEAA